MSSNTKSEDVEVSHSSGPHSINLLPNGINPSIQNYFDAPQNVLPNQQGQFYAQTQEQSLAVESLESMNSQVESEYILSQKKKDGAKEDEAKEDEAKKDGAKEDEAKKDEAKKDGAKEDGAK